MSLWTKAGAFAAIVFLIFIGGYYLKGKIEEAEQADILRQQIKATSDRLAAQGEVAKQAEAQIQADRQALAAINRKWNTIRAQNDRAPCQLDPDTLRVLGDADAGNIPAR